MQASMNEYLDVMNTKKLIELAESVLKHANNYNKTNDLKDLAKAMVRSRNFLAAALRVEDDRRKK